MNITPINAVSFAGRWEVKDTCLNPDMIGSIKDFQRIHTYHPDAGEPEIDIAMKLFEKDEEFSGAKK